MKALILATVLTATIASAGSMSYDAFMGCNDTCVTVSLSWADLETPVFSASVLDNTGGFLFGLEVPSPPVTTGSLLPNPQTVFGLSPTTVQIITNGQPVETAAAEFGPLSRSVMQEQGTYANVYLFDYYGDPILSQRFIATAGDSVPEPGSGYLAIAGLGLLGLTARKTRMFSQR